MDSKLSSTDQSVIAHIQQLVEEEHRLFEQGKRGTVGQMDGEGFTQVQVAKVRPSSIVEFRYQKSQHGEYL